MYPTILDTQTNERKVLGDWDASVFWWVEGNGSCDCNRAIAMGHEELENQDGDQSVCFGHNRFIAVDVHGDFEGLDKADILRMMNEDYPHALVAQHLGT